MNNIAKAIPVDALPGFAQDRWRSLHSVVSRRCWRCQLGLGWSTVHTHIQIRCRPSVIVLQPEWTSKYQAHAEKRTSANLSGKSSRECNLFVRYRWEQLVSFNLVMREYDTTRFLGSSDDVQLSHSMHVSVFQLHDWTSEIFVRRQGKSWIKHGVSQPEVSSRNLSWYFASLSFFSRLWAHLLFVLSPIRAKGLSLTTRVWS